MELLSPHDKDEELEEHGEATTPPLERVGRKRVEERLVRELEGRQPRVPAGAHQQRMQVRDLVVPPPDGPHLLFGGRGAGREVAATKQGTGVTEPAPG